MIAAIVAVPLGLVMGRFQMIREFVFPLSEVMRPIPAIARCAWEVRTSSRCWTT